MPLTTQKARDNILAAVRSPDPIGGLLSRPANSFRLAIRDSLRRGRATRFGEHWNPPARVGTTPASERCGYYVKKPITTAGGGSRSGQGRRQIRPR